MSPAPGPVGPKHAQPALRPLLPSSSEPVSAPPTNHSTSTTSSASTHVKRACQECQRRKTKCSGDRPVCKSCARRRVSCIYDTADPDETPIRALKRKHDAATRAKGTYEELLYRLASGSNATALLALQHIRDGKSAEEVLSHLHHDDLPQQLLLTPDTNIAYPFPFLAQLPHSLQIPTNEFLNSALYRAALSLPPPTSRRPSQTAQQLADRYHQAYLSPHSAARIISSPLWSAQAAPWTTVIVDDGQFQLLLHSYFLHSHTYVPCFHKDSFLHDLVEGRRRFCSPALVNAVLAKACHSHPGLPYAGQFWNPDYIGYRFQAEAKRCLEIETTNEANTLVNVQTTFVLHAISNFEGMDAVGVAWLKRSLDTAKAIELFGTHENIRSQRERVSRAFTAWCLFNYQTAECFYYLLPPLLIVRPDAPPPPVRNEKWYGEFILQYPTAPTPFPLGFPSMFKALSELRVDIFQITSRLFADGNSPCGLSAEEAMRIIIHLGDWYRRLAGPLRPEAVVLPGSLMVLDSIEYHGIILNLPSLLDDAANESGHLPAIRAAALEARIRFETLIRLFHMRHDIKTSDGLMTYFCAALMSMTLQEMAATTPADEDGRPVLPPMNETRRPADAWPSSLTSDRQVQMDTLIIGAQGLYYQGHRYHVAKVVYQLMRSRLSHDAAQQLHQILPRTPEWDEEQLIRDHVRSQFLFPSTKSVEERDLDAERLEYMVVQQSGEDPIKYESESDEDRDEDDTPFPGTRNTEVADRSYEDRTRIKSRDTRGPIDVKTGSPAESDEPIPTSPR